MAGMPVHGVDISHHQGGNLDMSGAKKRGLRWLYHKATEGTSVRDNNYPSRRKEAGKAGLPFGAYHFARPDRGDAEAEARYFLDFARPKPGDLRCALDLETTEGMSITALRDWADRWCDVVRKATGAEPIIYTPFDLAGAQRNRLIWRPRYNNSNTPPVLPWDIWQFSNGVYGNPNELRGIGHVDLNTMRKGLKVNDLLIPKHKDNVPDHTRLHTMHCSMQFSDSTKQKKQDVEDIFTRAKKRNVAWITGTEGGAGSKDLIAALKDVDQDYGYRTWTAPSTDAWIAVRRSLIAGGWDTFTGPTIIPGEARKHTAKKVVSVNFKTEDLGRIHVIAAHYLTKGRPNAKDPVYRQHIDENRALATAIGEYAKKVGKGSDLVFYGGDQNIVDRTDDTFFGQPLTSAWDELKKWRNTGHGNIDVIASYDRDGRVSAAYCRALNDKKFPLHTDHFVVEAGFDVRHRK